MTHIFDLFSADDLIRAQDAKLVSVRADISAPYRVVYNYTDKAPYTKGAWDNPAVLQCRGLVTDEKGVVVARPWKKFFNYKQFEDAILSPDDLVEVTDKKDGSLGIAVPLDDGSVIIATRGSVKSEQAIHATKVWQEEYWHIFLPEDVTLLFEIIYPENRIVLNYDGLDDLVLLGAVVISTGEYLGPVEAAARSGWTGPVTEVLPFRTFRQALEAPPRPNAEGLVVRRLSDNRMVKLKQEDYLELHRLVSNLNPRRIWELLKGGRDVEEVLGEFPDEFVDEARMHAFSVTLAFDCWKLGVEMAYATISHIESQKDFAAEALQYPFSGALFTLRKGDTNKFESQIWDAVKPMFDN